MERTITRDEVLDCTLKLVRAGALVISRQQIAATLGVRTDVITALFPRAFVIMTEAIDRRARQVKDRFSAVLNTDELTPSQRLDQLQAMILSLYASDAYLLELQISLWRDGHLRYNLIKELKHTCTALLYSQVSMAAVYDTDLLVNAIWGTCEHCALISMLAARRRIFDSSQLLVGRLVLAA